MKTVRRLLYIDILTAVAFVEMAFLSLSFFIDFVEQLGEVGQRGYTLVHAALYSLLQLPGHCYEGAPIAVLLGTIYSLSRMAQSSEYTILRTGGLGPGRALSLLVNLGLMFSVLTFVVGDYIAPLSESQANQVLASARGEARLGGAGAWLKDHANTPEGERSYSINVASTGPDRRLNGVRIFEFDPDGRLTRRMAAAHASVEPNQTWSLRDVTITRWTDAQAVHDEHLDAMDWHCTLSASVVAAAVSPDTSMSTVDLARYIVHLSENEQAAQGHQVQFWKRALYPFACLVMVALALPFAYLHARAGGVSLKIFGGFMLGISFVLLNNVAGYLALLHDWTPWVVASAPSLLYLLLSLAAFSWLVRYR